MSNFILIRIDKITTLQHFFERHHLFRLHKYLKDSFDKIKLKVVSSQPVGNCNNPLDTKKRTLDLRSGSAESTVLGEWKEHNLKYYLFITYDLHVLHLSLYQNLIFKNKKTN